MDTFQAIIDTWPSQADLAADLGTATSHIRTMRARDSIPAGYWGKLVEAAARRGIDGVTFELLTTLKTAQRPAEEPAA